MILRKTGDRQTDDRKTANRKTGDKTGDKKILNKTDDIKTQKCSVIVIPSYQSPHCTYRRTCNRKTGNRKTDGRKTGRQATGRQATGGSRMNIPDKHYVVNIPYLILSS